MADLVSERAKQEELQTVVQSAADNHKTGLEIKLHHRLASEYGRVTRHERREVMGTPYYYCEILPIAPEPTEQTPKGTAGSVPHAFEVWLIYEWSDAEPYSGSSQETFDNLTEGMSPKGILPTLRDEGYRQINGNTVTVEAPRNTEKGIIPLGQDGGELETAHRLITEVVISEPR